MRGVPAMQFFPVGAGLAAALLCIVLIVLTIVFAKRKRPASIACGVFSGLFALYLLVGCCVLFPTAWRENGYAYFSLGVQADGVRTALVSAAEKETPFAAFVPGAETYQTEQILYKNGAAATLERQSAQYADTNSRVEIELYTFASEALAKSAFAESQNEMTAQFGASEKLLQVDGEGWTALVSPVAYDGSRFLLPTVDVDGASLRVIAQCKNQYILIREQSQGQSLTLPDALFR